MTFLRTLLINLHNRKAQKRACKRLDEIVAQTRASYEVQSFIKHRTAALKGRGKA